MTERDKYQVKLFGVYCKVDLDIKDIDDVKIFQCEVFKKN